LSGFESPNHVYNSMHFAVEMSPGASSCHHTR
jgi:hypothetical protein